jgi:prepilin-type N-terminal cleavage/methylation domain-containing protein
MRAYSLGFTLIELIIVIVLLGVLSAFALPRFADLSSNAEDAVVEGFVGAIRSARSVHYATWQVNRKLPVLPGYTAVTNSLGVLTGILDDSIAHEIDCETIWDDFLDSPPTLTFVSAVNGYASSFLGDSWGQSASQIPALGEGADEYCHFVYVTHKVAAPTIRYHINTGVIDLVAWPYNP